jgi:hypothetical protein
MRRTETVQDCWSAITFTRHALLRMSEANLGADWVIRALQRSEQVTLPPEMIEMKMQKYTPEIQEKVLYRKFGSILFTVMEEFPGQMVLLTVTNQHVEDYTPFRSRDPRARPREPDEAFRSPPYRTEKKWR